MKKILFISAILFAAVSCLDKSTYNESYPVLATFEYGSTDSFNSDSLFFDTEYKIGFNWNLLQFYHKINEETEAFEGGFLLSYLAIPESEVTEGLENNLYRVNTTVSKAGGANTFAVFSKTGNMPENEMGFLLPQSMTGSCTMQACYVNNTVAVADAVREKFVSGNKLLFKATGYLNGTETGSASITLAEKTTDKDSVMYTWTEFDLSALGSIDKVVFDFDVPQGVEIPTAVCIDNILANISLSY